MAKKKKKPAKNNTPQKKPFPVKKVIIAAAAAVVVAALVAVIVINVNADSAKHALRGTYWVSESAVNASGDEVDIREVYNVRYSNYQGNLHFDSEDKFELWLAPGDRSDGTHSGSCELKDNTLAVKYDNGTSDEWKLTKKDGKIVRIDLAYDSYTVSFYPAKKE